MKNELYINHLLRIFDDAFNSNIDFASMDSKEFLKFASDFMEGKTEYYRDDYFLENFDSIVSILLNKISQ